MSERPLGPLGIDPLAFSGSLFALLFLFVLYLLLPRGVRVQYFGAYPKRYAWSARSRGGRGRKKSDQVRFYCRVELDQEWGRGVFELCVCGMGCLLFSMPALHSISLLIFCSMLFLHLFIFTHCKSGGRDPFAFVKV